MTKLKVPWESLPKWHEPDTLFEDAGSRDPLGFQRRAAVIAEELLPNITVLTRRARYYSYICWVIDQIWKKHEPMRLSGVDLSDNDYNEILARFERFHALAEALYHHQKGDNTCSWVGKRGATAFIRKYPRSLRLDIPLSKDEGGNGIVADYRQSLEKIGLFSSEENNVQYPLTDVGKKLADTYHAAVKKAKGVPDRIVKICCDLESVEIKRDIIESSARAICLSNISKSEVKLLSESLLAGMQLPVYEELKKYLDRRKKNNEADILVEYFKINSGKDIAIILKQNAFQQLFSLACLAILKGITEGLGDNGEPSLLGMVIWRQLQKEKISPTTQISKIVKNTDWEEEMKALVSEEGMSAWIKHSTCLIHSLYKQSIDAPEIIRNDSVESVPFDSIFNIVKDSDRSIKEIVASLAISLIAIHNQVHESKNKNPWIYINGNQITKDSNAGSVVMGFPPNTIRVESLKSLYNDLGSYHA